MFSARASRIQEWKANVPGCERNRGSACSAGWPTTSSRTGRRTRGGRGGGRPSAARLPGSWLASNAATSPGSGRIPQRSSAERRANSASVQVALGGMPSSRSLPKIEGSMGLVDGGASQAGGSVAGVGRWRGRPPTCPPNRAMIAASPTPSSTATCPDSSTVARSRAFDWYCARWVTSVDDPSLRWAVTRSCCVPFGLDPTASRGDFDFQDRGAPPRIVGHPLRDPTGEGAVFGRFPRKLPAAAVAELPRSACGAAGLPRRCGKTRRPRPSRTRLS